MGWIGTKEAIRHCNMKLILKRRRITMLSEIIVPCDYNLCI